MQFQRALAPAAKDAFAIADGDESGGEVRPLQLRDAQPHFEFTRAIPTGIIGRPFRRAQDGYSGDGRWIGRGSYADCEHQAKGGEPAEQRTSQ